MAFWPQYRDNEKVVLRNHVLFSCHIPIILNVVMLLHCQPAVFYNINFVEKIQLRCRLPGISQLN